MDDGSKIREIDVWIDDFTPCLKDNLTGEVVNTEVIRIRRKSFLGKFNRKSGWYVNWGKIVEDYEVYALVLEGTVDIQGLVALKRNDELKAMYIAWMCTAPQNNPQMYDTPKYAGVGGHLFAIAGSESAKAGFGGAVYGYAANQKVLQHYLEKMNATHVGILHPYQFCVFEKEMQEIIKTYTYAYSGEDYMSQEYEPVDESLMPYLVDIRAIKAYADSKGVAIADLSDEEKKRFMIPNPNYRKKRRHSIVAVF